MNQVNTLKSFFSAILNIYPPLPLKFVYNMVIGSWLANFIFLLIHEAAHGLIFGPNHPNLNKAFGLFINLFLGLPIYCFFRRHHIRKFTIILFYINLFIYLYFDTSLFFIKQILFQSIISTKVTVIWTLNTPRNLK